MLLGLALGDANGEEKRKKSKLEAACKARGRAAAPGTSALSRLLPGALARFGHLALGQEDPTLPDLHVSEAHSHAKQRLPARPPAAAAKLWDKGSFQPVLQPRAREPGASERRWDQPPEATRSAVPTRLSVPAAERVFLTNLMTPQPLQRTDP